MPRRPKRFSKFLTVIVVLPFLFGLHGIIRAQPDSGCRPAMNACRARLARWRQLPRGLAPPGGIDGRANLIRYGRDAALQPHDAEQQMTGDVDGAPVAFRSVCPNRGRTLVVL